MPTLKRVTLKSFLVSLTGKAAALFDLGGCDVGSVLKISLSLAGRYIIALESVDSMGLLFAENPICSQQDNYFSHTFFSYWNQELLRKASGKKPRLWMVLAKSFKWRFLIQAILAFIEVSSLLVY